jgi:hypothetical protein
VFKLYSDKFSKRAYAQHQLAVAILLMKYERKTYRDIADLLKELLLYFGLDGPMLHFTTLEKFFMRIPVYIWDFLLAKTRKLFEGDVAKVVIDPTGYDLHYASRHYEKRIGRLKRYMKHFISVDTDNQVIVVSEDWRPYVNDSTRFRSVLSKTVDRRKVHDAVVDKGFDAEENHWFAHKTSVDCIIPLKWDVHVSKTKGKYRKRLRSYFPQERYDRRPSVETVNSVEKRKFGNDLRSRLLKTQRREMKVVDFVYNIHRYINYVVSTMAGFLQNHKKNT